jgi:hypothetical protein
VFGVRTEHGKAVSHYDKTILFAFAGFSLREWNIPALLLSLSLFSNIVMKHSVYFFVIIFILTLFSGCGGNRPDDLPQRYPCKIKILFKNEPVTDASVSLVNSDSKWGAIGVTGNNGIAEMKTQGVYSGVPIGRFKVLVSKYEITSHGDKIPPDEKMLFNAVFVNVESTPLECTIEKKNNELTFEVY